MVGSIIMLYRTEDRITEAQEFRTININCARVHPSENLIVGSIIMLYRTEDRITKAQEFRTINWLSIL